MAKSAIILTCVIVIIIISTSYLFYREASDDNEGGGGDIITQAGLEINISFPRYIYESDDIIEFTMMLTNHHSFNISVINMSYAQEISFIDPDNQTIRIWEHYPNTRGAPGPRNEHDLIDLGPGESIVNKRNLSSLWSFTRTGIHRLTIGYDARDAGEITQPYWNQSYHQRFDIEIINGNEERYILYWRDFNIHYEGGFNFINLTPYTDFRFNSSDYDGVDVIDFIVTVNGEEASIIHYRPWNETSVKSNKPYHPEGLRIEKTETVQISMQYRINLAEPLLENTTFFSNSNQINGTMSFQGHHIIDVDMDPIITWELQTEIDDSIVHLTLPTGLEMVTDQWIGAYNDAD